MRGAEQRGGVLRGSVATESMTAASGGFSTQPAAAGSASASRSRQRPASPPASSVIMASRAWDCARTETHHAASLSRFATPASAASQWRAAAAN